MARKKEAHGGGGHGWFVTFADLMGLLVAFFVMLVAFSTQDQAKLQVVAGSMRDAFGVQDKIRYSGVIEVPVGEPDARQRQTELIERSHELVDLAARIDEYGMLGRRIPQQGAVLLQGRDRHEAQLQLRFGRGFCHGTHIEPYKCANT